MKKGLVWSIILLIIVIIIIVYYRNKNSNNNKISKSITNDGTEKILTYRLPTNVDPDVFGPSYWKAIHSFAKEIPCSACRNEWESMMIFSHDAINFRLKKPIFNEENFSKWLNKFSEIKKERDIK